MKAPNTKPVIILRHPQEKEEPLATAPLMMDSLEKAHLKTGLSWRNLKAVLSQCELPEPASAKSWAVLYVGSQKNVSLPRNSPPGVYLERTKSKWVPATAEDFSRLTGLVVLDGNWKQAKTLWWRNAWLLKLTRLFLVPAAQSLYGNLRREPRRECVSSLEAVAFALSRIESNPEIERVMLESLRSLIDRFRK